MPVFFLHLTNYARAMCEIRLVVVCKPTRKVRTYEKNDDKSITKRNNSHAHLINKYLTFIQ